jgi:hypothetical protein
VHGDPNGNVETLYVTGAGTRGYARLDSWTLDVATKLPLHLEQSAPFQGHDVKLHVLDPQSGLFVSGRRLNAALWLTSWTVADDGSFAEADSLDYGNGLGEPNAREYGLAHRRLPPSGSHPQGSFVVATPIADSVGNYQVVTWEVDAATGDISFAGQTQAAGTPGTSELSITHLSDSLLMVHGQPKVPTSLQTETSDELFAVSYSENGVLRSDFWRVSDSGTASEMSGSVSGQDVRGEVAVQVSIEETSLARFTQSGFLTASLEGDDQSLEAWELRDVDTVFDAPVAYLVSDTSHDTQPGTQGVQFDDPIPQYSESRAILTDFLWEAENGTGAGALYEMQPQNFPATGIGSIAKVMTYVVALEEIELGVLTLDDLVGPISDWAVQGPSKLNPPLQVGDIVSLRTLLAAMMKVSDNIAARAIGEHIANLYVGADEPLPDRTDWFRERREQVRIALGMSDTIYCDNPAGGAHSTPQDQVTLWRYGVTLPGFFENGGGVGFYTASDFGEPYDQIGGNFLPLTTDVVGLDGRKGGTQTSTMVGYDPQGQLACDAFAQMSPIGNCITCLIAQASRLGRPFLAEVQQSANDFDRANAVKDLLYYGIESTFTPDRRSHEEVGVVLDFDIAQATDAIVVHAAITPHHGLEVCSWESQVGPGVLSRYGCLAEGVNDLQDGFAQLSPARIEIEQLSTLESEGDFLTGHVVDVQPDGGLLSLRLWRIAPRPNEQ